MRRHRLTIALAIFVVVGCCVRAPWVQGSDASAGDASLGLAPIWTTAFRNFPGARVDARALASELFLSLAVVGMIALGRAVRRN